MLPEPRSLPPGYRVITDGLRFPEGPVWMPDGSPHGMIVLVEIEAGRLTRIDVQGRKETVAQMSGGPNGAGLGPDGKLYITNNGGFSWHDDPVYGLRPTGQAANYSGGRIERVELDTGRIETLYTHCMGRPLKGPNDLVFDDHGGFYFTDLGKTRAREIDRAGVYYAKADGSDIREIVHPTLTANGCALSADGRTLYFVETESARLWAVDIASPGVVTPAAWPSPHGGRLLHQGGPAFTRYDSMAVDAAGNICIATLINGGITVVSPDGKTVRHVPLPDPYVTNICFGGPDLGSAYVTLSGKGQLIAFDWHATIGTHGLKLAHCP